MTAAKEKLVGLIAYLRDASMEVVPHKERFLLLRPSSPKSTLVFAIIPGGGVLGLLYGLQVGQLNVILFSLVGAVLMYIKPLVASAVLLATGASFLLYCAAYPRGVRRWSLVLLVVQIALSILFVGVMRRFF